MTEVNKTDKPKPTYTLKAEGKRVQRKLSQLLNNPRTDEPTREAALDVLNMSAEEIDSIEGTVSELLSSIPSDVRPLVAMTVLAAAARRVAEAIAVEIGARDSEGKADPVWAVGELLVPSVFYEMDENQAGRAFYAAAEKVQAIHDAFAADQAQQGDPLEALKAVLRQAGVL